MPTFGSELFYYSDVCNCVLEMDCFDSVSLAFLLYLDGCCHVVTSALVVTASVLNLILLPACSSSAGSLLSLLSAACLILSSVCFAMDTVALQFSVTQVEPKAPNEQCAVTVFKLCLPKKKTKNQTNKKKLFEIKCSVFHIMCNLNVCGENKLISLGSIHNFAFYFVYSYFLNLLIS